MSQGLSGDCSAGNTVSKTDKVASLLQNVTRLLRLNALNRKWVIMCELAIFIVLVLVVWGLLSLPIVFFYITDNSSDNQEQVVNEMVTTTMNNSSPLDDTNDLGSGVHVCQNMYTGSHCLSVLQEFTACESSGRSDVYISNFIEDQNEPEEEIGTLIFALNNVINPSEECRNQVIPFFCLYTFGLCGENSADYRPTEAECLNIRDSVCQSEWETANDLLKSLDMPPLPDCSSFGDNGLACSVRTPVMNNTPCTIECHEDFYCENNFCSPRCDRFREYPDSFVTLSDVLMIISGTIGLLCGIVVIVIFVIRRKTMMVFPTILVFYSTISLLAIAVVIITALTDRSALFCDSIDLLENLDQPTAFCKLTGIANAYIINHATLWWIFHIFAIFWKIQFPFHSRHFENTKKTKYVHITFVVLAVLLPIFPAVLTSVNGGFVIPRFPPFSCVGRESASNFYGIVVPITVMYAIGTTVLLAILWRIRRHMGSTTSNTGTSFHFSAAESKIFIVFVYYLFSGALQLTTYSVANTNIDHDVEAILTYFACQRFGRNDDCSLDTVQNPVWALLAIIFLLLFPAINFVYAVRANDIMRLFKLLSGVRRIGTKSDITMETNSFPSSKQVQDVERNNTQL